MCVWVSETENGRQRCKTGGAAFEGAHAAAASSLIHLSTLRALPLASPLPDDTLMRTPDAFTPTCTPAMPMRTSAEGEGYSEECSAR